MSLRANNRISSSRPGSSPAGSERVDAPPTLLQPGGKLRIQSEITGTLVVQSFRLDLGTASETPTPQESSRSTDPQPGSKEAGRGPCPSRSPTGWLRRPDVQSLRRGRGAGLASFGAVQLF